MHFPKQLSTLLFMIVCTNCVTVSQQQQLNYKGKRAYFSTRYQEALQHYEKALNAAYKNKDRQYIAIAMYGLGRTNIKLCRLDEAEYWLKKSIAARNSLTDTHEAYITQNLSELARLYIAQERYADANALLDRAVPLLYRLKVDRSDPIALANQLDEYEISLRRTERTVEADAIAKKSIELRQNNPGKIALFRPDQISQSCLAANHQ